MIPSPPPPPPIHPHPHPVIPSYPPPLPSPPQQQEEMTLEEDSFRSVYVGIDSILSTPVSVSQYEILVMITLTSGGKCKVLAHQVIAS